MACLCTWANAVLRRRSRVAVYQCYCLGSGYSHSFDGLRPASSCLGLTGARLKRTGRLWGGCRTLWRVRRRCATEVRYEVASQHRVSCKIKGSGGPSTAHITAGASKSTSCQGRLATGTGKWRSCSGPGSSSFLYTQHVTSVMGMCYQSKHSCTLSRRALLQGYVTN